MIAGEDRGGALGGHVFVADDLDLPEEDLGQKAEESLHESVDQHALPPRRSTSPSGGPGASAQAGLVGSGAAQSRLMIQSRISPMAGPVLWKTAEPVWMAV